MKTEIVNLTPELAAIYLSKNNSNRHCSGAIVLKYAHDITNGNWQLNGESIKIALDGEVLDGQHRMKAVIKANKSIKTFLVTGLNKNVSTTIDTGKPRSAGNVFHIDGIANANNVASSITKYLGLCKGAHDVSVVSTTNSRVTHTDILNEYYNNPQMWQDIHKSGTDYYKKCFHIITPSDYCALHLFFQTKYKSDAIDSFFDSMLTRDGIGGMLFERLLRNHTAKYKMAGYEKTALIIKSFNYFIKGKLPKVLKYSKEEQYPSL